MKKNIVLFLMAIIVFQCLSCKHAANGLKHSQVLNSVNIVVKDIDQLVSLKFKYLNCFGQELEYGVGDQVFPNRTESEIVDIDGVDYFSVIASGFGEVVDVKVSTKINVCEVVINSSVHVELEGVISRSGIVNKINAVFESGKSNIILIIGGREGEEKVSGTVSRENDEK